tara:strand:+ start:130 stop:345 length:216 start_codon:yes stop_codon:yes gene_type:complete
MEDKIYDIVTDLIRDDITKDKAIEELLVLCDVGKQRELLNRFVREWNKEVSKDDEMYCIDDTFVNEFKKTI